MGWFWGNSNKDDPVNKLDPGLREYLQHEAPSKYVPTTQVPSSQDPSKTIEPQAQTSQSQTPQSQTPQPERTSSEPAVPSASLFPDGRYADLWKTYKPPTDDGAEMKGAERVIGKEKERKGTVHRAAMENCALEHEALTYCFQTGNWQKQFKARMTLCSEENSSFSRCFTTQAKFLQALGYASSFNSDEDREERIQLHADKLYHQMLDYEKQVENAQAAGVEPPPITSLFNPQAQTTQQSPKDGASNPIEVPGGEPIPAGFKPSKPLEKLSPHERELEIRSYNSQLEQQKLYVQEASPFMKAQEDARLKRQEKAVGWFGETIGRWVT